MLLVIYLAIYFYLTIGFRRPAAEARIILTPLWSYREAIEMNPLRISRLGVFRQILLNILLTIPPGLLLPVLYRTKHPYLMTFLTILALSLVTESLQYFTHLGLCEIDDLINNLLGGLIGMGLLKIGSLSPKNTKREV